MAAPIQHHRSGDHGPFASPAGSPPSPSSSSSAAAAGGSARGAKWINPCRVPDANKLLADGAGRYEKIPDSASDTDLVKQILDSVVAAYSHADKFKLNYVSVSFHFFVSSRDIFSVGKYRKERNKRGRYFSEIPVVQVLVLTFFLSYCNLYKDILGEESLNALQLKFNLGDKTQNNTQIIKRHWGYFIRN
jgi:hypothetical protein